MPRTFLALTLLALVACGKQDHSMSSLSSEPVSVRGWILDVKGAQRAETFPGLGAQPRFGGRSIGCRDSGETRPGRADA